MAEMEVETSGQRTASREKQRRDWLTLNILIQLEDNYRITFTDRQIDTWIAFFSGNNWTRDEIIRTRERILRECKWPPTGADWDTHRARKPEPSYYAANESIGDTANRLMADLDPDSWEAFLMRTTAWGVSPRGRESGGMREAYRRIIAEGEKRRMPEHLDHHVYTGPPGARRIAYTLDVGLNAFRRNLAAMEEI